MRFNIIIDNTGESFSCAPDGHVLEAMEKAMCRGIPVGCRNGGCGACKILVTAGRYTTRKMNRAVVTKDEEADGYVLACKTYPMSDLTVTAVGELARDVAAHKSVSYKFEMIAMTRASQTDKER